jgi:hypothetical protein
MDVEIGMYWWLWNCLKIIYVNELWYIWIENCDDKWILLKLECIDGYGIVGKSICEWVMIYLD